MNTIMSYNEIPARVNAMQSDVGLQKQEDITRPAARPRKSNGLAFMRSTEKSRICAAGVGHARVSGRKKFPDVLEQTAPPRSTPHPPPPLRDHGRKGRNIIKRNNNTALWEESPSTAAENAPRLLVQ